MPGPADSPKALAGFTRVSRVMTGDHADLVRAALIVVFVLLGLQLMWAARILVLTAFLGVLLRSCRVPRRGCARAARIPPWDRVAAHHLRRRRPHRHPWRVVGADAYHAVA